ncbi:hypothetical protein LTR94_029858, partial [Friedmanniomyces endolithicus]
MERARLNDGSRRRRLAICAGLVGALAIWTTHFVAMQGYAAGVAVTYDVLLTLVSVLIILAMASLAIFAALIGESRPWRVLGALIAVSGVGAMHYVGMAALQLPAHIHWRGDLVAFSLVAALATGAATAFFYRRGGPLRLLTATVGAALSILILHYVGMAALIITPDVSLEARPGLSPEAMRNVVYFISMGIGATGAALAFTAYLSRASALNRIREAIDAMPDGMGFYDADDRLVLWNARYAE